MGAELDLGEAGRKVRFGPLVRYSARIALAACSKSPANEVDAQVYDSSGTAEVTAQLVEIPGPFPPNDLYNYAYVLKYKVLKIHRGNVPIGRDSGGPVQSAEAARAGTG